MTEPSHPLLASVPKFPRGVRLKHDEARQEWVLLAPERLIKCDPIAAAVLQLCDSQRTLSDIVTLLANQFNADRTIIERDVIALLQGLSEKKMVQL
jgi:pyrroloquinoline quinone biosynthesis protein D